MEAGTPPGPDVLQVFVAQGVVAQQVRLALRKGKQGRPLGRLVRTVLRAMRLAQAAMAHRDTSVSELCRELGIRPVTLYRYVGPQGQLREQGQKVLAS